MVNKIQFFSDASFSPQHKIGVIGWRKNDDEINTEILTNITDNVTCECHALLKVLEYIQCNNTNNVYEIYVDCNSILEKIAKRDTIKKNQYRTKKGKYIHGHILYEKIFNILDNTRCNIYFYHIDGHKSFDKKTVVDHKFSTVDKLVRKRLRRAQP